MFFKHPLGHNQGLKEELAAPPAKTLSAQIRFMKDFVSEYNFNRPHEVLEMKTPGDHYGLSPRAWDGRLRSPEYDLSQGLIRKVGQSGVITIAGTQYYVGQALTGEYIQLKKVEERQKFITALFF